MKKIYYMILAAAGLFAAACSSEEIITTVDFDNEAQVTLTAQLPSNIDTRAYSDGLTATYLTYAVYMKGDENSKTLVTSCKQASKFSDRTCTVTLSLAKGKDYEIVFWADAGPANSPYTITIGEESTTIAMDYSDDNTTIEANNEYRDAFHGLLTLENVTGAFSETVNLYRPFAQLNIGTDDLDAPMIAKIANIADIEFSVTIPAGLPTTFCLNDSTTSDVTNNAITFTKLGVPAVSDGTFPVEGYSYVSMNYLLVGAGSETKQTFSETDKNEIVIKATHASSEEEGADNDIDVTCTVKNVPFARNYRTNIYGSLLTVPAVYNIIIVPNYTDEYNADLGYLSTACLHSDACECTCTTEDGDEEADCSCTCCSSDDETCACSEGSCCCVQYTLKNEDTEEETE